MIEFEFVQHVLIIHETQDEMEIRVVAHGVTTTGGGATIAEIGTFVGSD